MRFNKRPQFIQEPFSFKIYHVDLSQKTRFVCIYLNTHKSVICLHFVKSNETRALCVRIYFELKLAIIYLLHLRSGDLILSVLLRGARHRELLYNLFM